MKETHQIPDRRHQMCAAESKKPRILFIGPLPPPIDGQSKATAAGLEAIRECNLSTSVINLNRPGISRSWGAQLGRILALFPIFFKVLLLRSKADAIYLSLSESTLGNIKDILIYVLLTGKLKTLTVQMLGGSGMNLILNKGNALSKINQLFMRQMNGVIVEGECGRKIFAGVFPPHKIFVVKNCADEYLFSLPRDIESKFNAAGKIQILYLSNMITEKGCFDLARAFLDFPSHIKNIYTLKFVGGFPEMSERTRFLNMISPDSSIEYLGNFIDGEEKKRLYLASHIFCLPTYYPYEGQPISILEAYATGCVVITTMHGGIPDIFVDQVNGFSVTPKCTDSIKNTLIHISENRSVLQDIALSNLREAESNYRIARYKRQFVNAIRSNKTFDSVICDE
jgi:glycosyltransferase involved in cell wall biosynthesis